MQTWAFTTTSNMTTSNREHCDTDTVTEYIFLVHMSYLFALKIDRQLKGGMRLFEWITVPNWRRGPEF